MNLSSTKIVPKPNLTMEQKKFLRFPVCSLLLMMPACMQAQGVKDNALDAMSGKTAGVNVTFISPSLPRRYGRGGSCHLPLSSLPRHSPHSVLLAKTPRMHRDSNGSPCLKATCIRS